MSVFSYHWKCLHKGLHRDILNGIPALREETPRSLLTRYKSLWSPPVGLIFPLKAENELLTGAVRSLVEHQKNDLIETICKDWEVNYNRRKSDFYAVDAWCIFRSLRHVADRVLVLRPGVRPVPLRWQSQVQDIGPPETSRLHVISSGKSSPRDLHLNTKTQLHSMTS